MDLNETAVFVKVVEMGSFAGAALQLEMPKSTVSAKVSALEQRLGVTLIRRTTRRLFVTEEGKEYHQQCLQALRLIASAEERASQGQTEPQGLLKVTAPVELGGAIFPNVIIEFRKRYPKVNLEIILTDRTVDLVSEGIDLALRAGELKDSSLIAKKLGASYFAPFASPRYLKSAGTPSTPKDLKNHCCLQFTPLGAQGWKLSGPRGSQTVEVGKHIVINDLNLIKSLAISGVGIALLPTFNCHSEVKDKTLVRVLDDWKSDLRTVQFVYPHQEFVPLKLQAFLDIATEIVKTNLRTFAF